MNSKYYDQQILSLEEDLHELLTKAEKLIGDYDGLDEMVNELLKLNTKESKMLASDIVDINSELTNLEDERDDIVVDADDDPFSTLYNEDDDLLSF